MARVIDIPVTGGLDESVDAKLLPAGKLAAVQNCRLTRDGRLEVRPNYTQIAATTYGASSAVMFDLVNYSGRLCALGDQVASGAAGATDLFEYVNTTPAAWKGAINSIGLYASRIPEVTDVRRVGGAPDQKASAVQCRIAAMAGFIGQITELADTTCTVQVFNPVTGQIILRTQVAGSFACVTAQGTKFWFAVQTTSGFVGTYSFDPLVDKTLTSVSAIIFAGGLTDLDICNFGTNYAVIGGRGASAAQVFFRNGTTGVAVSNFNAATLGNRIAGSGNAAGTLLTLIFTAGSTYTINTYNAAGALQNGPTALFGSRTLGGLRHPTLTQNQGVVRAVATVSSTQAGVVDTVLQTITQATHVLGATTVYGDSQNAAQPALAPNGVMYVGAVSGSETGRFASNQLFADESLIPQCFPDGLNASMGTGVHGSAVIGTKIYWVSLIVSEDTGLAQVATRPIIYEAETSATQRRQMACLGNELHISGGLPLVYDGGILAEQGFAEDPFVFSGTQGTGGSLTLLSTYNVKLVWEVFDSRGLLLRSAASPPLAVTLTGANNKIDLVLSVPHSLRTHPNLALDGGLSVRAVIYRALNIDSVFYIDGFTVIPLTGTYGQPVTFSCTQLDTQLDNNEVLYEQAQTPLSNFAPPPYRYTWAARERQFVGAVPDPEQWQFSKLLFPAQPVEFASPDTLGFSGRVAREISAVASFEETGVVWTPTDVYQIAGRGPDFSGNGEFDPSQRVPSPGGCRDWRSVVSYPGGIFFQMVVDRLMLLSSQGAVTSAPGERIQTTLDAFPVVVGAVHIRGDNAIAFACNNVGLTDARILVYDVQRDQWYVDTVGAAIASISELDGRIVYLSGGVVFLQDLDIALGAGALPTLQFDTGVQRPFATMGYGDIIKLGLLATYLGDCTVDLQISYDDSKTFATLGTQAVTTANMVNPISGNPVVSGDPIQLLWTPNKRTTDRFSLRVIVTNPTNTGGIRVHMLTSELESQDFATRLPARNQH